MDGMAMRTEDGRSRSATTIRFPVTRFVSRADRPGQQRHKRLAQSHSDKIGRKKCNGEELMEKARVGAGGYGTTVKWTDDLVGGRSFFAVSVWGWLAGWEFRAGVHCTLTEY